MLWSDDQIERALAAIDPATTAADESPRPEDWARMRSIMAENTRKMAVRRPTWPRDTWSTPRLTWAIPALAALVAIPIAFGTLPATPSYAQTPPMLTVAPLGASVEDALSESTQILRSHPESTPIRNGQVVRWKLREDGRDDPVIVPEWQTWVWNEDGTGYLRATADAPYSVTNDGRIVPPVGEAPTEGTPMERPRWGAPGSDLGYFPDAPPSNPAELREYLHGHIRLPRNADALTYWGAIGTLLDEWTLSPAQQAAAIELLQDAGGVSILGTVTDRLGREGIALSIRSEARPQFGATIVLDRESRRIIASDTVYLGGIERLDVPDGSVIEYSAWLQRSEQTSHK